jgi:hypothetical protein
MNVLKERCSGRHPPNYDQTTSDSNSARKVAPVYKFSHLACKFILKWKFPLNLFSEPNRNSSDRTDSVKDTNAGVCFCLLPKRGKNPKKAANILDDFGT